MNAFSSAGAAERRYFSVLPPRRWAYPADGTALAQNGSAVTSRTFASISNLEDRTRSSCPDADIVGQPVSRGSSFVNGAVSDANSSHFMN